MTKWRIAEERYGPDLTGWVLQHRFFGIWCNGLHRYSTLQDAKTVYENLTTPKLPPDKPTYKVVHPYDATPAGKAHR